MQFATTTQPLPPKNHVTSRTSKAERFRSGMQSTRNRSSKQGAPSKDSGGGGGGGVSTDKKFGGWGSQKPPRMDINVFSVDLDGPKESVPSTGEAAPLLSPWLGGNGSYKYDTILHFHSHIPICTYTSTTMY